MPDPDAAWNRAPGRAERRWRRFSASLPMRTALIAVGSVWILGCVWSYQEQSAFAASKGFTFPHLLPLVIDGFAVSMAGVAWAASLDARPAIPARLATLVAVAASSASNGVWAYLRANHDMVTVVLGVTVPIAANLAFEVLLAELRRQVQRRRGLPPPVAVPYPRMIRIVLAPWQTFRTWRAVVLEITAMDHAVSRPENVQHAEPGIPPTATAVPATRATAGPARTATVTRAARPAAAQVNGRADTALPAAAHPAAEPARAAQSGHRQPTHAESPYADAHAEPQYARSPYGESRYAEPDDAQPESAGSEYAQPEYAQPDYAQPDYARSDDARSDDARPAQPASFQHAEHPPVTDPRTTAPTVGQPAAVAQPVPVAQPAPVSQPGAVS
ncbi:MAG TPA: DUF2637 domain-containing protein, partial [Pseudonocardia sp.]|nr:DUF2637 domain-containing protein [Pseudonocardia sp.]